MREVIVYLGIRMYGPAMDTKPITLQVPCDTVEDAHVFMSELFQELINAKAAKTIPQQPSEEQLAAIDGGILPTHCDECQIELVGGEGRVCGPCAGGFNPVVTNQDDEEL